MSLPEQMNAFTRLAFILFLIIYIFDAKFSVAFFIICLIFIIIIYYIKRDSMTKENYTPDYSREYLNYTIQTNKLPSSIPRKTKQTPPILNQPNVNRFCTDYVQQTYDKNQLSKNQKLANGQNPRTLVPPIIVTPSHDIEFWRDNNLIINSHINAATQQDVYQSGYVTSTCCGYLPPDTKLTPIENGILIDPEEEDIRENITMGYECQLNNDPKHAMGGYGRKKENFQFSNYPTPKENGSGQVNVTCGYNPRQLYKANLPTNLPAGNCDQSPELANYNKNLFTQTISPGVYTTDQIIEPINSNIGISFTQQFPPTTCSVDREGNFEYTQHDPRLVNAIQENDAIDIINTPTESNVYDPRFTGYGTSYRSYSDKMTGQTRFMYDDVNAIRMPNYITRSKIDFAPFADTYGPVKPGQEFGNEFNSNIRALANDKWLRDSIEFRNDLTERRMRKVNAEAWQQRSMPSYKTGRGF
jgi:hypothetical protein